MGFQFKVEFIPGAKNVFADFLSRNPREGEEAPFYPRLVRPSLFHTSGSVNRVNGGEVVDMTLLRLAEIFCLFQIYVFLNVINKLL